MSLQFKNCKFHYPNDVENTFGCCLDQCATNYPCQEDCIDSFNALRPISKISKSHSKGICLLGIISICVLISILYKEIKY